MEEKQHSPKGDNRYRVHRSVKCYLLQMLCGTRFCTLHITDSIERVVYKFPNGTEKIQYKNKFYDLQPAEKMTALIKKHLADKGAINLPGKSLDPSKKHNLFDPYPFIDITDTDNLERYPKLREQWLNSDEFQKST